MFILKDFKIMKIAYREENSGKILLKMRLLDDPKNSKDER